MAVQIPILQLLPRPKSHLAAGMSLRIGPSRLLQSQEHLVYFQVLSSISSSSLRVVSQNSTRLVSRAINMTSGQSGSPEEMRNVHFENVRSLWDRCPEPIRVFPWKKAYEKFVQRLFSLAVEVAKWLFIPILIVSSLSEMTYCGGQNKELLIPIGMLAGSALAGILKETAVELSEKLKEGSFPWHLVIIGAFFALVKFPGPYYPYWGRVFLPHFANGGLWITLWFAHIWYKKPSKATEIESNRGKNSI
eukprot:Gb_31998 [translate_table: standard]